jgi:hypothetical protein
MQAEQPELLNRCEILTVPALDYDKFEYVARIRLQREKGIESTDIAKYIAQRCYNSFNQETNMRRCIRISRLSNSYAMSNNQSTVTKEIVDKTISWVKGAIHNF